MLVPLLLPLFASNLDAVLDNPALKGSSIGAIVIDDAGKVIYERNASTRLMPASNQKLLSAAFALAKLGPTFRPMTRFWVESDRVVVDAPGDPSLTWERLAGVKRALRLTGKLPVYVREAYCPWIPESWELDDLPNRYAAPVCSFSFDQSAFAIWAENGRPFLLPQSFGVRIIRGDPKGPPRVDYDWLDATVRVEGELPKKRTRLDTLALYKPDAAAARVIGSGFHTVDSLPVRAPDYFIEGDPLPAILATCLTHSDNNMAENLLLMATAAAGPLGADPYKTARDAETAFLTTSVGLQPEDLRIFDGSGMSRHDLVTARAIGGLLFWESRQPTFSIWKASLVTGGAGTMSTRLKDVDFHGKTGSLDMVAALSGYVAAKNGRQYIFSLLLNNFTCPSATAREIADSFARTVALGGDGTPVAATPLHAQSRIANEKPGFPDVHRLRGPHRHRRSAPARADRGAEPRDATFH